MVETSTCPVSLTQFFIGQSVSRIVQIGQAPAVQMWHWRQALTQVKPQVCLSSHILLGSFHDVKMIMNLKRKPAEPAVKAKKTQVLKINCQQTLSPFVSLKQTQPSITSATRKQAKK